MRPRGFANPDHLIVLAVVFIILAIAIPAFVRTVRQRRDAPLISDVRRVQAAEDAYRAARGRWADTLTVGASPGAHLEGFRTDSTGWSVVVVGDSGKTQGRRCAMFDGADLFRPSGEVNQPRELTCW